MIRALIGAGLLMVGCAEQLGPGDVTCTPEAEVCDGVDNDCDGLVDDADPKVEGMDWFPDLDNDGFGGEQGIVACEPPENWIAIGGDCGDRSPEIRPNAIEVCDGIDNDCDTLIDDDDDDTDPGSMVALWVDRDGDGFGNGEEPVLGCLARPGFSPFSNDCTDFDPSRYPGALDRPGDFADTNCDGVDFHQPHQLGPQHVCGVRHDGHLQCWGNNRLGEAAIPDELDARQFADVDGGYGLSCALDLDGQPSCWGIAAGGEVPPPSGPLYGLSVGHYTACALDGIGSARCWGFEDDVMKHPPDHIFVQLSVGGDGACGVDRQGSVRCWGEQELVKNAPQMGVFTQVSVGEGFACARETHGSLACWSGSEVALEAPDLDVLDVAVHGRFACARRTVDRDIECWGDKTAWVVAPRPGKHRWVSVGADAGCTVTDSGELDCFGANPFGELAVPQPGGALSIASNAHTCMAQVSDAVLCFGDSDHGKTQTPELSGMVFQITAGATHTCALNTEGDVTCWGGVDVESDVPLGFFAFVDAGGRHGPDPYGHTCGIIESGQIRCWGDDREGQLEAPGGAGWVTLSAGARHSCAVDVLGSVSCWGADHLGQSALPDRAWTDVGAGRDVTCAVDEGGGLFCTGDDLWGLVSEVPSAGSFVGVSVGEQHACAVTEDGELVCWGENIWGSAGPMDFDAADPWERVTAGVNETCAVARSKRVGCWGQVLWASDG